MREKCFAVAHEKPATVVYVDGAPELLNIDKGLDRKRIVHSRHKNRHTHVTNAWQQLDRTNWDTQPAVLVLDVLAALRLLSVRFDAVSHRALVSHALVGIFMDLEAARDISAIVTHVALVLVDVAFLANELVLAPTHAFLCSKVEELDVDEQIHHDSMSLLLQLAVRRKTWITE
jgi:hypothetical protein